MKVPNSIIPKCSCGRIRIRNASTLIKKSTTRKSTTTTPILSESIESLTDLLNHYPIVPEWSNRLISASKDLKHPRNARIVVIGTKEAGTSELVTAAFDEPDVGEVSVALASRRLSEGAPEAFSLVYGDTVRSAHHELAFPSAWLREKRSSILEIVYGDVPPLQTSIDALYAADTVVLLVSEGETLSPSNARNLLQEFSDKPNFILALNSSDPSHPSTSRALSLQLDSLLAPNSHPSISFVSTQLAIDALEALNPLDSTTPPSIDQFQSKFSSSGIVQLKDQLADSISSIQTPSTEESNSSMLQEQTARYIIEKCIRASTFAGAKIEDELFQASTDVAALQFQSKQAENKAYKELGVSSDGRLVIPPSELIASKKAVEDLFNTRLNWYKLLYRSDDIPAELSPLLQKTYLQSFESSLIFNTGRLISLSQLMSIHTDSLLSTTRFSKSSSTISPLSSLYSPILLNHLAQATVESSLISSTDLSTHLTSRRNQLVSPGGPVDILQIKSQEAVLNSITLSTSSLVVGVVMDLMEFAELGVCFGISALGCAVAMKRLQSQWHKAKIRFGRDLEERVTRGLEEDLGEAAKRLVDRTLYKSRSAVVGAESLIRRKKVDYDGFAKTLYRIDRNLKEE